MTLATHDLDADKARALTEQIRYLAEGLVEHVVAAYRGRIWLALGYGSWDDWKAGELGDIELPRNVIPALKSEGMSARAIATVTGVGKSTVDRAVPNGTTDRTTGIDGKSYPAKHTFECLSCRKTFDHKVRHCASCGRHWKPGQDCSYCDVPAETAEAVEPEQKNPALYTSDSDDWWTPADVLERVVATLGAIDLDPCSNLGQPNVPASQHLTIEDDGLSFGWVGRVFMNPPYGDVLPEWVTKLVDEYRQGNVEQAIALLPGRIDTKWCAELDPYLRCHIRGRLKFSGQSNSAPFPSMAVYLGSDDRKFIDAFSPIGTVFGRVE